MRNGIEVYCKLGGDRFTLHRTGSYMGIGNSERHRVQREGFAATNANGTGHYHWIFIPAEVAGDFERCANGTSREIQFKNCIIGPTYFNWEKEWWESDK